MSQADKTITCRRCGEEYDLAAGSCPQCGADVRGRRAPIIALVFGLVVLVTAITDIGELWFFAILGLLAVFAGGYLLYEQRNRIRPAEQGN